MLPSPQNGEFLYIVHELKNYIDVYTYKEVHGNPEFDKIQTISTLNDYHAGTVKNVIVSVSWFKDTRCLLSGKRLASFG